MEFNHLEIYKGKPNGTHKYVHVQHSDGTSTQMQDYTNTDLINYNAKRNGKQKKRYYPRAPANPADEHSLIPNSYTSKTTHR